MRARMQQYAGHASWAVWGRAVPAPDQFATGDSSQANLQLPADDGTDALLHGRAVLLGLNPGNAAQRLHQLLGDWYAFHSGSDRIPAGFRYSNDHLIAEACRDTGLWGAYMTDLFPTLVESASGEVAEQVRTDPRWVRRSISAFSAELEELAVPQPPVLVCFGDRVLGYARAFLTSYPADRIVGVTHYSGAAAGKHRHDARLYRELFHAALDAHPFARTLL